MEKQINEEELFIPKTKHKALKIILASLLIIGLMVGGYFLYQEKFNNPNKIVSNILDDASKETNTILDITNNKYKVSGLIKMEATLPNELQVVSEILKNLDLQFSGEIDDANKIFNVTINSKYKNNQLMDIKTFIDNDNIYILLDGLYDKYLKASTKDTEGMKIPQNSLSIKDIEIIKQSIIKAFKDSTNNLSFNREDETIKIDNKDINVYKISSTLQEKEIKSLLKDILNHLANDKEFTNIIGKLTNENAKEKIDELKNNIDEMNIPGNYQLVFYTDKNVINPKLLSVRLSDKDNNNNSLLIFNQMNSDEEELFINVNEINLTLKSKKNNSALNISADIKMAETSFKFDLNTNYEKIKEITKPDVSNSIEINKLTEEEAKKIEEKIQNNQGLASLLQDISNLNPIP